MKPSSIISFLLFYSFSNKLCKADDLNMIIDDGKYYVIELTSLCIQNQSAPLDYEAIRQHLKLRYLIGRQQKLNPYMKIGFVSYDVCYDTKKLNDVLTRIFLDAKYRSPQRISTNKSKEEKYCNSDTTNIIAVISFMPHYMTKMTSDVLTLNSLMYFAYNNHSSERITAHNTRTNMFTSDMLLYSDIYLIIENIKYYGFRHISLIYINNDKKESLVSLHRQKIWEELIKIPGMCIDMKDLDVSNATGVSSYVQEIKRNEKIKLFIIWSKRIYRGAFINQTSDIQNRIWMWYSDNSFDNNYDYDVNPLSLITHIFIWQPVYVFQHLNTRFKYKYLKRNILSSTFQSILEDDWIKRFNYENDINVTESDLFSHFDDDKGLIGEHIESLFTPLWWSQPFKELYYRPSMSYLWSKIRRLTRVKMCRHILYKNTTRVSCHLPYIKILFKRMSVYNNETCKPYRCPAGYEPVKEEFSKKGYVKVFQWRCRKCSIDKVKSENSTDTCVSCSGLTIPNNDLTDCFDPYKDEYLSFIDVKSIILLSLMLPSSIYIVAIIIIFCKYRTTPVIVASSATASLVQLTAHLLIFAQIIFSFFGKLDILKCTTQVVMTGSLFTLILSLLITKTQKILFAFEAKIHVSKLDVVVTKAVEIFVSVLLLLVQVLLSCISYVQLTPSVYTTLSHIEIKRSVRCDNKLFFRTQYIYILILAIMCSIQAFRARNLPKYFTETTEIAYSMYITIVIIVIRFPIISSRQIEDKNFANAVFVALLNNIQMTIRYTSTLYTVLFDPEKNTKKYFRSMIMRDIRKKTEERMDERIRRNTSQDIR